MDSRSESKYYYNPSRVRAEAADMRDPEEFEREEQLNVEFEKLKKLSSVTEGYISAYLGGRSEQRDDGKQVKVGVKRSQWSVNDLKKLIAAKRHEFETSAWSKKISRRQEIADLLQADGVTDPVRDEESCRKMWEILSLDWWAIYDYDRMRKPYSKSYYDMSPDERDQNALVAIPREFPREIYNALLAWLPPWLPKQRDALLENWRSKDPRGVTAQF